MMIAGFIARTTASIVLLSFVKLAFKVRYMRDSFQSILIKTQLACSVALLCERCAAIFVTRYGEEEVLKENGCVMSSHSKILR